MVQDCSHDAFPICAFRVSGLNENDSGLGKGRTPGAVSGDTISVRVLVERVGGTIWSRNEASPLATDERASDLNNCVRDEVQVVSEAFGVALEGFGYVGASY